MNKNITCNEVKGNLYEYINGEIKDNVFKTDIENHLQACADCRLHMERTKNTLNLLNIITPPPLSQGFLKSVTREIEKISPKKSLEKDR
ncbi:MAG: zf-HC2 domain-containing protein [Nitrospirae bacterium]|nr:zf-HC2 domain-containing protein [Nitrospirota bacterium]